MNQKEKKWTKIICLVHLLNALRFVCLIFIFVKICYLGVGFSVCRCWNYEYWELSQSRYRGIRSFLQVSLVELPLTLREVSYSHSWLAIFFIQLIVIEL